MSVFVSTLELLKSVCLALIISVVWLFCILFSDLFTHSVILSHKTFVSLERANRESFERKSCRIP